MLKIQKLDVLIAVYMACVAMSELMGGKTFPLLNWQFIHLNASVAIFVVPLVYAINDVITERFGKERAQSIVRSGLFTILLYLVFSLLATHLPPSKRFLSTEKAYETVFDVSARIAAASFISFTLGEFLDVLIFYRIRKKFGTKALWLRTNVSNIFAQLVDTGLFMILAFYAFDKPLDQNVGFLLSLIIPYWLLKCFMSIIETPLVYLGVLWLKEKDK